MASTDAKPDNLDESIELTQEEDLLVLARIGKVHGLKGWLRVSSYTSPPENVQNYGYFSARKHKQEQWRQLEVTEIKRQGNGLVAHFKGFDDPESASVLTGQELAVRREELPGLDEDDYYWHQLQGLTVKNLQGQSYGLVDKIIETGANDVLVVKPTPDSLDDKERLVPYLLESVIHTVDLDAQTIVVDWDADFLQ